MEKRVEGSLIRRRGIDGFGADILHRIFTWLPPPSLVHCAAVCTLWHNVIKSTPNLWGRAYFLKNKRLAVGKTLSAGGTSSDGNDADFLGCYIDEEMITRLAHGRVSVRSWKAHSSRVNCCRMTMEEIVSGSSDQMVRVWSAKTLKCTEQYKAPAKAPVVQVEFDENKVMGAAGNDVHIWRRTGNRRLLRRMGGQSVISSFCVADADLATGCIDGTVRLFDLYSSRCTQMFRLHTEPVKAVVMDVATQSMASGSTDGTIQVFDVRSGQKIASLLRPASMTGITCLHLKDTDCNLFAGTLGGDLYSFDFRNRKTLWNVRVPGLAVTCIHSPTYTNSAIGMGGSDGAVKVYDLDTVERIATFRTKPSRLPSSPVLGMALGMTKLVTSHADSSMTLWLFGEPGSGSAVTRRNFGRQELVGLP